MTSNKKDWGWWSEVKLEILQDYLRAFTTAVRLKSKEAIYLDLFAGAYDNKRRGGAGTFPGSARIALETQPAFTRLVFFELHEKAIELKTSISQDRGGDSRWSVIDGDSNQTIATALCLLAGLRWAPTFAFLDPRGLQIAWSTIETLANWRSDKKTKVEQWILLPEPALARVLGLQGASGKRSVELLDRLYGTTEWRAIHQLRRANKINPDEMRSEFVNLLRWRLQHVLHYKTTHALQIVNTHGSPIYTMIFATDSEPGDKIMNHVYSSASTRTIPNMQDRARTFERQRLEASKGIMRLPGFEHIERAGPRTRKAYDHTEPWEPPPLQSDTIDLSGEDDIDPEDVDLELWAEELEREGE